MTRDDNSRGTTAPRRVLRALALTLALTACLRAQAQHEGHGQQPPPPQQPPQPTPPSQPPKPSLQPPSPPEEPQHEGHEEPAPSPPQPTVPQAEPQHGEHGAEAPMQAPPAEPGEEHEGAHRDPLQWLNARAASGTSWQPDHTPAWAWHWMDGARETMLHALGFVDATDQDGPRGDEDVGLSGWAMVMQRWPAGAGRFTWRGMFSPEAAGWGEEGYPELFQVGESLDGGPLIDRQHPHDLFMELAALLEVPVGERWAWHGYFAASGEPALGPPAFPHRASAAENPQAPLGHHQQDSTHISFGVVTLGFSSRLVRLEASAFNGREPDQERWDFDFGPMDSYAARVSVNPSRAWSFQVSAAQLAEPEELKPDVDADRVTASVHHAVPWHDGYVASALVWGRNDEEGEDALTTWTLESTVSRGKSSGYVRLERSDRAGLRGLEDEEVATVAAVTLGYVHDVHDVHVGPSGRWGIGAHVTFHGVLDELEEAYGSSPVGVHVFGRWRAPRMAAGTHGMGTADAH